MTLKNGAPVPQPWSRSIQGILFETACPKYYFMFLQQQSESLLLIAFLTDDSVIELFIYLKLFIWHVNSVWHVLFIV